MHSLPEEYVNYVAVYVLYAYVYYVDYEYVYVLYVVYTMVYTTFQIILFSSFVDHDTVEMK